MEHLQPDLAVRISERQMRLWNALHSRAPGRQAADKPWSSSYRFLTLSRDEGSLGDEVAVELANRLEWQLFDKEIVNYIAKNNHVREAMVQQLEERSQGLIQEAILRLLRMPESAPFGSEEYHEALLKALATLATRGNAVLVGRGANFVLHRSEHGLHVRITGSLETRAYRASENWKVPIEKARSRLTTADADKRSFIRRHFRKDIDDPRYYDLVFNTDHLSVDKVADSVMSAMLPENPPLIKENRETAASGSQEK
jgi:hypothetical protein